MTAVDVACDSSSEPSSPDSLISAMMHPEFYPKPPDEVSYQETHISHLFFAGDLVYKVKKAVHFSFLDYSSLVKRRHYLQEELRLNRRLAPSVYLGVMPIAFDESGWRLGGWSEPREYTLVMRRLPEKRMLRFLIDTHQADGKMMRELAKLLADFHSKAERVRGIDPSEYSYALEKQWKENLSEVESFLDRSGDREALKWIRSAGSEFIAVHKGLLMRRAIDGWIREIKPAATTGALVRKGDTLAVYYAPEFLSSLQAYLFALGAMDRFQATGKETEAQLALTRANIQQAKNSLLTLGMSEQQANEIAGSRQLTEEVRVVAPAGGFIVARNLSSGQRFEKGTEFFRIADLSHVWVMTDFFEKDREFARPGSSATVHYQGKALRATMSDVLPQFDPQSRTLKTRFELDNPGFLLRPDMFVDVEFRVNLPPALTVPADSVVDSGKRKTVFVARGNGFFEPREVETGWRLGDRLQITQGLAAGEQVVVSGNFLIDSESRMRQAAAGAAKDPVCGMDVDAKKAGVIQTRHDGITYTFCSAECQRKFAANPGQYVPQKTGSADRLEAAHRSLAVAAR